MTIKELSNTLISLFIVCAIVGISFFVIAYGRGYRMDFNKKSFGTNGLIAATSDPTGAQLFIDGKAKTATNTNITVAPGWYTVTVVKNGYQPWEKYVRVQGEVLTRVDPVLFSSNPSLYALTSSGVENPTLSSDGTKLGYIVPQLPESTNGAQLISRSGVWVLDLLDKPLGMNRDARQILKREQLNTDASRLTWSPDSKQLLLTTPSKENYILESDKLNESPKFVQDTLNLSKDWEELKHAKDKEKLLPLKDNLIHVATESMRIIAFSPDETKILYEASKSASIPLIINPALIGTNTTEEVREIKTGNLYVYDIKEDRNYAIGQVKEIVQTNKKPTPTPTSPPNITNTSPITPVQWLPTSRHLVLTSKDKVEVMDFDGTNKKVVYAGPFWDGFVAPWSNAGKIVILTNLNPAVSAIANLYAVNIR